MLGCGGARLEISGQWSLDRPRKRGHFLLERRSKLTKQLSVNINYNCVLRSRDRQPSRSRDRSYPCDLLSQEYFALHDQAKTNKKPVNGTKFTSNLPHVNMENAFAQSTSEVLKFFSVSEAQGLTDAQVQASREKFGRNGKPKTTLRRAKQARV